MTVKENKIVRWGRVSPPMADRMDKERDEEGRSYSWQIETALSFYFEWLDGKRTEGEQ